jgi:hypothetical protein
VGRREGKDVRELRERSGSKLKRNQVLQILRLIRGIIIHPAFSSFFSIPFLHLLIHQHILASSLPCSLVEAQEVEKERGRILSFVQHPSAVPLWLLAQQTPRVVGKKKKGKKGRRMGEGRGRYEGVGSSPLSSSYLFSSIITSSFSSSIPSF